MIKNLSLKKLINKMNKEEILNDDFVEKEVIQPKSHKKIKIAIAITASLAIIATTILLVGYFKFDWFKSEHIL